MDRHIPAPPRRPGPPAHAGPLLLLAVVILLVPLTVLGILCVTLTTAQTPHAPGARLLATAVCLSLGLLAAVIATGLSLLDGTSPWAALLRGGAACGGTVTAVALLIGRLAL
ncbi:hypothetical protein [Streptomyces sp. MP131-18]|uniref:hypothetical protein n=1 Tax=Streptomyces sp. MP131-18 TaxID=1857892 RepID=UPI00097C6063|nr:hypothetical protein [Streptomyces sp. MP131-18]ONK13327.1 hypothetical protein STBA_40930 [Streptomyces sp. MP131-18]